MKCDHFGPPLQSKKPNWVHVLCVTSLSKYEQPHITVSHKQRASPKLRSLQKTPVSLSLWGENCVGHFCLLGFSLRCPCLLEWKWPFSREVLEHNRTRSFHFTREENAMRAKTPCVRLHMDAFAWPYARAFVCAAVLEWERTTLRSKFPLALRQSFPTTLSRCQKLQTRNSAGKKVFLLPPLAHHATLQPTFPISLLISRVIVLYHLAMVYCSAKPFTPTTVRVLVFCRAPKLRPVTSA